MARSLDFNKIKHRIKLTPLSSEEAMKSVTPIDWSKEVISGEKKVEITNLTKLNKTDLGATINDLLGFIENASFEFEPIIDNL